MTMSVSIIIANYNNSKYLDDCLKSVSMQSFADWEAIVVDDGSSDSSVDIINNFCNQDSRFSLIQHEKNRGLSVARNTGLKAARGKYIIFLDSDDCINPNALEKLYEIACNHSADAVKAQRLKVEDSFKIKNIPEKSSTVCVEQIITNPSQTLTAWYKDPMFAWLYLYKRSAINACRFYPGMRPCEDVNFTIKTLSRIKKLIITDVVAVFYRLSSNSIMQNYKVTDDTIASKVANCVDINKFFDACSTCSATYQQISKKMVYDLLLMDILFTPLTQRKDLLKSTQKILKSLSDQYDIMRFYNLRTRLTISMHRHKIYWLSGFLLDRKYFEKYTRTKKRRKNENTNNK